MQRRWHVTSVSARAKYIAACAIGGTVGVGLLVWSSLLGTERVWASAVSQFGGVLLATALLGSVFDMFGRAATSVEAARTFNLVNVLGLRDFDIVEADDIVKRIGPILATVSADSPMLRCSLPPAPAVAKSIRMVIEALDASDLRVKIVAPTDSVSAALTLDDQTMRRWDAERRAWRDLGARINGVDISEQDALEYSEVGYLPLLCIVTSESAILCFDVGRPDERVYGVLEGRRMSDASRDVYAAISDYFASVRKSRRDSTSAPVVRNAKSRGGAADVGVIPERSAARLGGRGKHGAGEVALAPLVSAGLLREGQTLYMRDGDGGVATATVRADGRLHLEIPAEVTDFDSPSPAASAVRGNMPMNGWVSWRLSDRRGAKSLSDIRDDYYELHGR